MVINTQYLVYLGNESNMTAKLFDTYFTCGGTMYTYLGDILITGVGGWECPISSSVIRMGTASWQFKNKAPNSASAADAMMLRSILHTTYTIPLIVGSNFWDHVVSGVCCSRRACLLLCFVLLGRISRRHRYGPTGPCHFVCTGWSHLDL